jgi:hypothetical protein
MGVKVTKHSPLDHVQWLLNRKEKRSVLMGETVNFGGLFLNQSGSTCSVSLLLNFFNLLSLKLSELHIF